MTSEREPDSLDEQALQEVTLNFPGFPPIKGVGPVIEAREDPPEYQHPEETFEEYERMTDEQLFGNQQD